MNITFTTPNDTSDIMNWVKNLQNFITNNYALFSDEDETNYDMIIKSAFMHVPGEVILGPEFENTLFELLFTILVDGIDNQDWDSIIHNVNMYFDGNVILPFKTPLSSVMELYQDSDTIYFTASHVIRILETIEQICMEQCFSSANQEYNRYVDITYLWVMIEPRAL